MYAWHIYYSEIYDILQHHIEVWMDHKNLEYFQTTKKLNCCQAVFPIILNGFTSHILISMTVIHSEYKLVHFEKHWGKDLTAQVTQMVQELVSYHKSSIYPYDYSNILLSR